MQKYNPTKMIPVEALGPYFHNIYDKDGVKKIKMYRLSSGQRKFMKEYHTRKSRRLNKTIEE